MNKFKSFSLIKKITSTIVLILIVPIMLVCIFYYQVIEKTMMQEANNRLSETLSQMELEMNIGLGEIKTVINEMKFRQEFSYFLDSRQVLSAREMNYFISKVQNELNNIKYLYPNKFNGILIYASNNQISQDICEWKYSFNALKEKPYYNEIVSSEEEIVFGKIREKDAVSSNLNTKDLKIGNSGVYVLPAYYKVCNLSTKKLIGAVEVDMPVKKLIGIEDALTIDNQTRFLTFDEEGKFLAGSKEFIEKEVRNIKFARLKDTEIVKIKGENYYVKYKNYSNTGLVNVALYNKKQVTSFSEDVIAKVIMVAVLSLICVGAIIYGIIRGMLRRLIILDDMMSKIEGGEFDVQIPDNAYEDEISRISRTFNRMSAHLREVIYTIIENEKAQQDAEFRALQAQINPHFLYNTLENMRMQCEIDGFYSLGDRLAALGDLFRYSIRWGTKEVTFDLEWNNLKNYIALMEMRYEEELVCDIKCDESIHSIIIPKMILQPLVENCFNHGFKNKLPPWRLNVYAYLEGGILNLRIEDNGAGILPDRLARLRSCVEENRPFREKEKVKNSIGVINVYRRIQIACDGNCKFIIESEPDKGTKIIIQILTGGKKDV